VENFSTTLPEGTKWSSAFYFRSVPLSLPKTVVVNRLGESSWRGALRVVPVFEVVDVDGHF
jgi:hypothetical protein